jgi:acyl-CoA thioester hydrolase
MSTRPAFIVPLEVAATDIQMGHVNNVAFVRFVQEAAVAHWQAAAPEELQRQYLWVVRRHEIEYLRPGMPGESLHARTWVGEPSGASWERLTDIVRTADGEVLVQARTLWVLLDGATGRPRRVLPEMIASLGGGGLPDGAAPPRPVAADASPRGS